MNRNYDNIIFNMFKDTERTFIATHNTVTRPVCYFIGRPKELNQLQQKVEDKHKLVLFGDYGIGKTQICRELFTKYATAYFNDKDIPFKHIGYIEYKGSMDSSLMNCLKYKQQANPEKNCEAVWKELEYLASGGKFLLFIDNVNMNIIKDKGLQRLKSIQGAIVLISRQPVFSKEFEPFRIGFLNTEQCREIYEKIRFESSKKKINKEEVPHLNYIIEKLVTRHTIMIEFLAHLAQTKHWTVEELRKELEQNGFQLEYKDEEDKLINIQNEIEKLINRY